MVIKLIRNFFCNAILLHRLVQAFFGLGTILLLTHYFSLEKQGWYFTFSSIAAVYTLFDLGLSVVLVQLSAHIFSSVKWLNFGNFKGRLAVDFATLSQRSLKFYIRLSISYLLIVGVLGVIFFSNRDYTFVHGNYGWFLPWCSLVIFTSLNILTLPYLALVEGSGQVNEVYYLRTIQNIFGSLSLWLALVFGLELWALSIPPMMSFLVVLIWLGKSKPYLLKISFKNSSDDFRWKNEVWPLQWRVGLSWLAGYLLTQIYTPILFHYHGAQAAGQMGLSLTVANMLGLIAQSCIVRRVPDMGKYVANKDWERFDKVFKHGFNKSVLIYIVGCIFLSFVVISLNRVTNYAVRILPILPFIGLLAVVFISHINSALAVHLRSYKKEPLVLTSLISTLITIPIALYSASESSVTGVVFAILLVQIFFTLPVTIYYWFKFNRECRLELS